MTKTTTYCDLCGTILGDGKIKKRYYGITWSFGYSGPQGWGSRENFPGGTHEVCENCFNVFKTQQAEFNRVIKSISKVS